jgi:hypothetical protein
MRFISLASVVFLLFFSLSYARVPNIVEHKLLLINEGIETELRRIGFTIAKTHPSKLSPKFTEQEFVRDCWILDDKGNVSLKLFFFLKKFQDDNFIKNETIRLNKGFEIGSLKYQIGIFSLDQQVIKTVVNIVLTFDVSNKKYDEYPY